MKTKMGLTYLLTAIIFLISSIPLLTMGFSGDDINDVVIKGTLLNNHMTLFAFTKEVILYWIHMARLFPVAWILCFGFSYLLGTHLILYNFFHWIIVIVSYFVTCIFFKKLSFSNNNCLFLICLLPFCWVLYDGTPLVSFTIILPALTILIMLAFINYINFLNLKQSKYCYYTTVFSILAFLTYEIAFIIIPVILLLNKYYKDRFFVKNTAMYAIFFLACCYLLAVLTLRYWFVPDYSGVALGNLLNAPLTFLKQLSGSVPLLIHFTTLRHVPPFLGLSWLAFGLAALLVIASFIANIKFLNRETPRIPRAGWILLLSGLLQVIPAFIISLSAKYQLELTFGSPHIPVFIQQIGFIVMLIIFCQWLLRLPKLSDSKIQSSAKIILGLLISLIIGANFLTNCSFSNWWNNQTQYPKEIYYRALSDGLFKQLPSGALILRPKFYLREQWWNDNDSLMLMTNRKDLYVYSLSDGEFAYATLLATHRNIKVEILLKQSLNNVYFLDIKNIGYTGRSGYVILGHVINMPGLLLPEKLMLENVKIFYTARSQKDLKNVLFNIQNYLGNDRSIISETNTLSASRPKLSGFIMLPDDINLRVERK